MPEGRSAIPADLRRAVLVESGHRCAVPTCRQHPVVIEHIGDWAQVKDHKFENLIALCPTCHRRKGNGPDQIDRKSLRQYKANLAVLNHRYGEVERRLIEYFAELITGDHIDDEHREQLGIPLGLGSAWQVMYLIRDGYLEKQNRPIQVSLSGIPMAEIYVFTPAGVEFVNGGRRHSCSIRPAWTEPFRRFGRTRLRHGRPIRGGCTWPRSCHTG